MTTREERETYKATLEEFYADEEVAKNIWSPSDADSWIPESRKSLKDVYAFTILADGKIAGEIGLQYPSPCRSSYSVGFGVGRQFWN